MKNVLSSVISSRDNPAAKRLRALLSSARERTREQLTVLEGIHLAQAWLAHSTSVETAVVAQSALPLPEVVELLKKLPEETQLLVFTDDLLQQVSTLDSGAMLCLVVAPRVAPWDDVQGKDGVILDGVQDPGNVGSILRSAAAAGVNYALLGAGCASAWAPRTLRAGMGAQFALNIVETGSLEKVMPTLGATVIATRPQADLTLYDLKLTSPIAWVFGSEGGGVSEAVLKHVDKHVSIPQTDLVESMNVAASAAVCCFEMRRQRLFVNNASN